MQCITHTSHCVWNNHHNHHNHQQPPTTTNNHQQPPTTTNNHQQHPTTPNNTQHTQHTRHNTTSTTNSTNTQPTNTHNSQQQPNNQTTHRADVGSSTSHSVLDTRLPFVSACFLSCSPAFWSLGVFTGVLIPRNLHGEGLTWSASTFSLQSVTEFDVDLRSICALTSCATTSGTTMFVSGKEDAANSVALGH